VSFESEDHLSSYGSENVGENSDMIFPSYTKHDFKVRNFLPYGLYKGNVDEYSLFIEKPTAFRPSDAEFHLDKKHVYFSNLLKPSSKGGKVENEHLFDDDGKSAAIRIDFDNTYFVMTGALFDLIIIEKKQLWQNYTPNLITLLDEIQVEYTRYLVDYDKIKNESVKYSVSVSSLHVSIPVPLKSKATIVNVDQLDFASMHVIGIFFSTSCIRNAIRFVQSTASDNGFMASSQSSKQIRDATQTVLDIFSGIENAAITVRKYNSDSMGKNYAFVPRKEVRAFADNGSRPFLIVGDIELNDLRLKAKYVLGPTKAGDSKGEYVIESEGIEVAVSADYLDTLKQLYKWYNSFLSEFDENLLKAPSLKSLRKCIVRDLAFQSFHSAAGDPVFITHPSNLWRLGMRSFQNKTGWKLLCRLRHILQLFYTETGSYTFDLTNMENAKEDTVNNMSSWRPWEMDQLSEIDFISFVFDNWNAIHPDVLSFKDVTSVSQLIDMKSTEILLYTTGITRSNVKVIDLKLNRIWNRCVESTEMVETKTFNSEKLDAKIVLETELKFLGNASIISVALDAQALAMIPKFTENGSESYAPKKNGMIVIFTADEINLALSLQNQIIQSELKAGNLQYLYTDSPSYLFSDSKNPVTDRNSLQTSIGGKSLRGTENGKLKNALFLTSHTISVESLQGGLRRSTYYKMANGELLLLDSKGINIRSTTYAKRLKSGDLSTVHNLYASSDLLKISCPTTAMNLLTMYDNLSYHEKGYLKRFFTTKKETEKSKLKSADVNISCFVKQVTLNANLLANLNILFNIPRAMVKLNWNASDFSFVTKIVGSELNLLANGKYQTGSSFPLPQIICCKNRESMLRFLCGESKLEYSNAIFDKMQTLIDSVSRDWTDLIEALSMKSSNTVEKTSNVMSNYGFHFLIMSLNLSIVSSVSSSIVEVDSGNLLGKYEASGFSIYGENSSLTFKEGKSITEALSCRLGWRFLWEWGHLTQFEIQNMNLSIVVNRLLNIVHFYEQSFQNLKKDKLVSPQKLTKGRRLLQKIKEEAPLHEKVRKFLAQDIRLCIKDEKKNSYVILLNHIKVFGETIELKELLFANESLGVFPSKDKELGNYFKMQNFLVTTGKYVDLSLESYEFCANHYILSVYNIFSHYFLPLFDQAYASMIEKGYFNSAGSEQKSLTNTGRLKIHSGVIKLFGLTEQKNSVNAVCDKIMIPDVDIAFWYNKNEGFAKIRLTSVVNTVYPSLFVFLNYCHEIGTNVAPQISTRKSYSSNFRYQASIEAESSVWEIQTAPHSKVSMNISVGRIMGNIVLDNSTISHLFLLQNMRMVLKHEFSPEICLDISLGEVTSTLSEPSWILLVEDINANLNARFLQDWFVFKDVWFKKDFQTSADVGFSFEQYFRTVQVNSLKCTVDFGQMLGKTDVTLYSLRLRYNSLPSYIRIIASVKQTKVNILGRFNLVLDVENTWLLMFIKNPTIFGNANENEDDMFHTFLKYDTLSAMVDYEFEKILIVKNDLMILTAKDLWQDIGDNIPTLDIQTDLVFNSVFATVSGETIPLILSYVEKTKQFINDKRHMSTIRGKETLKQSDDKSSNLYGQNMLLLMHGVEVCPSSKSTIRGAEMVFNIFHSHFSEGDCLNVHLVGYLVNLCSLHALINTKTSMFDCHRELFIQIAALGLYKRSLKRIDSVEKKAFKLEEWKSFFSDEKKVDKPTLILGFPSCSLYLEEEEELVSKVMHYRFVSEFDSAIDASLNISFYKYISEIVSNLSLVEGESSISDMKYDPLSPMVLEPQLRVMGDATPRFDKLLGWLGLKRDSLPALVHTSIVHPMEDSIISSSFNIYNNFPVRLPFDSEGTSE
jgi:hypothetical protein